MKNNHFDQTDLFSKSASIKDCLEVKIEEYDDIKVEGEEDKEIKNNVDIHIII